MHLWTAGQELHAASSSTAGEQAWQAQMAALHTVRRAIRHHPSALLPELPAATPAILQVAESLRSAVARLAMVTLRVGSMWGVG